MTINEKLLAFLEQNPTCFQVVESIKAELNENGYAELYEHSCWNLQPGGKYYVTRNGSSILAFRIPEQNYTGFMIAASHSDSPSLKIKENPEVVSEGYVKLNVENYGGLLCAPWFDRPLSVAGRIIIKKDGTFSTRLINVDRDLLMLPSLAIHMNRSVNSDASYNAQKDMMPVFALADAKGTFFQIIADAAGCKAEEIKGHDLFLYPRTKGSIWGAKHEFISAPHLDDLQCSYADYLGFMNAAESDHIPVLAIFDNEEVGSTTKQGANSTFLTDTLNRINGAFHSDAESFHTAIANSFMISADNAHAVHPNNPEKADPVNRPAINGGIVIKYHAGQKYTTDGVSAAIFKELCEQAEVPYQTFTNRSDAAGGSTLGNISNSHLSLNTVDIGLPQLAMHSPYETAGTLDTEYLVRVMERFFSSSFTDLGCGNWNLK